MTDVARLQAQQAEWQKRRASMTWPEKVRMAERVRDSLAPLRHRGERHLGKGWTKCDNATQLPDHPSIDWTGVQPDQSPIGPLDDRSFVVRLRLLSERARSLTILRKAFTEQHSHGEQLSRDSEPASRPSR